MVDMGKLLTAASQIEACPLFETKRASDQKEAGGANFRLHWQPERNKHNLNTHSGAGASAQCDGLIRAKTSPSGFSLLIVAVFALQGDQSQESLWTPAIPTAFKQ